MFCKPPPPPPPHSSPSFPSLLALLASPFVFDLDGVELDAVEGVEPVAVDPVHHVPMQPA